MISVRRLTSIAAATRRESSRSMTRTVAGTLAACCVCFAVIPRSLGDDLDHSSLRFIPAGTHFYSTTMRLGELWESISSSQAARQFFELPLMQIAKQQLLSAMESEDAGESLRSWHEYWSSHENQQLKQLLLSSLGTEYFLAAGESVPDFQQRVIAIAELLRESSPFGGGDDDDDPSMAEMRKEKLTKLGQLLDQLEAPGVLLGMRCPRRELVGTQFARLEQVSEWLDQQPGWSGTLRKVPHDERLLWVLTVDGRQVPWEMFEESLSLQFDAEMLNLVINKVRGKKLEISLAEYEDFLLVAIGCDAEPIRALGRGPLLRDREELQPLRPFAHRTFLSVTFASGDWLRIAAEFEALISKRFEEAWDMLAAQDAGRSDDMPQMSILLKGVEELEAELAESSESPQATSQLAFEMLAETGLESYLRQNGKATPADHPPLTLTRHSDAEPLYLAIGRWELDENLLDRLAQVAGRIVTQYEQHLESEQNDADLQRLQKMRERLGPLAHEFLNLTKSRLLPAWNRQLGIVIDAQIPAKLWWELPDAADLKLRYPEVSISLGLGDQGGFQQFCRELRDLVQQIVDQLYAIDPEEFPELRLSSPESRSTEQGTIYYFRLPAEWSWPQQIAPSLGIGAEVALFSYSPQQVARLLRVSDGTAGMLALSPGQLPVSLAHLNFERCVETARPWLRALLLPGLEELGIPFARQIALDHLRVVEDLLACYQQTTSVTYLEGETVVTRRVIAIRDLR